MGDSTRDTIEVQNQSALAYGILRSDQSKAVPLSCDDQGNILVNDQGGGGGSGTDDDAIHDNVAGEIAAIAEKVVPVDADIVIIEDSEAANVKKKVQLSNLPGASSTQIPDVIFAAVNSPDTSIANEVCAGDGTDHTTIINAIEGTLQTETDEVVTAGPFDVYDDMDDPVSGGGPYTWAGLVGDETLSQDAGDKAKGAASLKIVTAAGTGNSGCKITALGGQDWSDGVDTAKPKYDTINLWVKVPYLMGVRIYIYDQASNMASFMTTPTTTGAWEELEFYIGCSREHTGDIDWSDIDEVHIMFNVTDDLSYTVRVDQFTRNTYNYLDNRAVTPSSYTLCSGMGGGGVTYVEDTHYTLDKINGRIKILAGEAGIPATGATLYFTYDYGGCVAGFLDGKYVIGGSVTPTLTCLTLLALGANCVFYLDDGSDTNLLDVAGENWLLEGILFDGNNKGQTRTTDMYGIRNNGHDYFELRNIKVRQCGTEDVGWMRLDGCKHIKIQGDFQGDCNQGIYAGTSGAVEDVLIYDSYFYEHSRTAIIGHQNCNRWTIDNVHFYKNGYCDVYFGGVGACTFIHLVDCVTEHCFEGSGLFRFHNTTNFSVIGGSASNIPDYAFYVSTSSTQGIIKGIIIENCYYGGGIDGCTHVTFDGIVKNTGSWGIEVTGTSGWCHVFGEFINIGCFGSTTEQFETGAMAVIVTGSGGHNEVSITYRDTRGANKLCSYGVYVSTGNADKVHDCVFSDIEHYPIYVVSGDDHEFYNIYIDAPSATNTTTGIVDTAGDNHKYRNITIRDCTNSISLGASVNNPIIDGCDWTGCTNDPTDSSVDPVWGRNIDKNGFVYAVSGVTFTIMEVIDHASIIDDGGAAGHYDLNDNVPAHCEFVSAKAVISEAFKDTVGSNTAVDFELGTAADDDRFYQTATTGDDIWNSTTTLSWGQTEAQGTLKTAAATTLRATFTTDSDVTDLIGAAGQGTMKLWTVWRYL